MPDNADKQLPPDARNETTQVRQAKTLGVMRWVLVISLVSVVAALIIAYAVMPLP